MDEERLDNLDSLKKVSGNGGVPRGKHTSAYDVECGFGTHPVPCPWYGVAKRQCTLFILVSPDYYGGGIFEILLMILSFRNGMSKLQEQVLGHGTCTAYHVHSRSMN